MKFIHQLPGYGIAMIVLVIAISIGQYFYITQALEYQVTRNKVLESEIANLDKKIYEIRTIKESRSHLLEHAHLVAAINEKLANNTAVFEKLSLAPSSLHLTSLHLNEKGVYIKGVTNDPNALENFINTLSVTSQNNTTHETAFQIDRNNNFQVALTPKS